MKRNILITIISLLILSLTLIYCSNAKKNENTIKPILKKTPFYHYNLGNKYFSEKKFDLAINEYLKAIELDPNSPEAYNHLGLAYFFNQRYQEAILSFEKVLD